MQVDEPRASATEEGGILRFEAWLPFPSWDKNTRLAPNCIRRESKAEGGRLYFKPGVSLWKLAPAAVQYRAGVAQLLKDVLPRVPFFAPGVRWTLNFEQYGEGDVDHYLAGILDDLCAAGLAKSDRDCKRRVVDVHEEENTMLKCLHVRAWQGIP